MKEGGNTVEARDGQLIEMLSSLPLLSKNEIWGNEEMQAKKGWPHKNSHAKGLPIEAMLLLVAKADF